MDISDDRLSGGNRPAHLSDEEQLLQEEEFSPGPEVQYLLGRAIRCGQKHDYDLPGAWSKVVARRRRRAIAGAVRYALAIAAVAIPAVWAVVSLNGNSDHTQPAAARAEIHPGKAQAHLILSDGEIFALERDGADMKVSRGGSGFANDGDKGVLTHSAAGADSRAMAKLYNTMVVPQGGEYCLNLSDGTTVWLNSESTLRFPEGFGDRTREVFLEGEAYFKVAADRARPFVVNIGSEKIIVTGTSFNVYAYPDEEIWHATLKEGSISFGDRMKIMPNEQLSLNRHTGLCEKAAVDASLCSAWIEGKFNFEAATFEYIMNRMRRWYDFNVVYTDESIKELRFTGAVDKHHGIEVMLKLMEQTTNIKFTLKGRTITASTGKNEQIQI